MTRIGALCLAGSLLAGAFPAKDVNAGVVTIHTSTPTVRINTPTVNTSKVIGHTSTSVNTANQPYLQYNLNNTLITGHTLSSGGGTVPQETHSLSHRPKP